jgi:hypothetical protein
VLQVHVWNLNVFIWLIKIGIDPVLVHIYYIIIVYYANMIGENMPSCLTSADFRELSVVEVLNGCQPVSTNAFNAPDFLYIAFMATI